MNEHVDFERTVAEHIGGESAAPPSDAFYDELFSRAGHTRQRPYWLAVIKEPPMRTASRLAYGSPTVRVAAIFVATLLLALTLAAAGFAGSRLLAADGAIIVAADGTGDYVTIGEAVAAAQDGDTLKIQPGAYTDAVVVDKDITLMGDGPRDEIVIGGPQVPATLDEDDWCEADNSGACAFVLDQTEAALSGVTFRGAFAGVGIFGGAPTIEGVLFDQTAEPPTDGTPFLGTTLIIDDGSNARIVGNEFIGGSDLTIQGVSNPLIEKNVMRGWAISADDPGDDTVIRGNDISGSVASAISVMAASTPLIEGNVLTDAGTDGIAVGFGGTGLGFDAIIRGNTIRGSGGAAITASPFAAPTIEGNTLVDNRFGVLTTGGNAVVDGNDIQGEGEGIILAGGGAPSITENTIDVTGRGISITRGSEATLSGNTVCGGDTSIFVDDESEPVIDDTNEICEVTAAG